ncbi:MAG TPA: hypothetical protein VIV12_29160 [Streptosporangiaceae bacterium]
MATGAHFRFVKTVVTLPKAADFANQVNGYGVSVHLWSSNRVLVLGLSDTTAAAAPYSAAVVVFDRSTHNLICATANNTCPNVGAAWLDSRNQFPAGDTVLISEFYSRTQGFDRFTVNDQTSGQSLIFTLKDTTSELYGQARVGAEFGCTPWAACGGGQVAYTPPLQEKHLVSFTNTRLTTYSGLKTSLIAPWTHSKLFMTADGTSTTAIEAAPHGLWNSGMNFGVFLEPAPL